MAATRIEVDQFFLFLFHQQFEACRWRVPTVIDTLNERVCSAIYYIALASCVTEEADRINLVLFGVLGDCDRRDVKVAIYFI